MAAGGGGIDGPFGPRWPDEDPKDEKEVVRETPRPSSSRTTPRSLQGRASDSAATYSEDEDHILIGDRLYEFPVTRERYENDKNDWGLNDLFRMIPPPPSKKMGTSFDFRDKVRGWVDAHRNDLDEEPSESTREAIERYFREPVNDDEEDIELKFYSDLRPDTGTTKEIAYIGATLLAENIQYISYKEFLETLEECVSFYVDFIQKEIEKGACDSIVVVLPNGCLTKSNSWVARLAYPMFKEKGVVPSQILTISEFEKYRMTHPKTRGVTLDDCSYSGRQLTNFVLGNSVDVVLPFSTSQARELITESLPASSYISPSVQIETLKEMGLRKLELICAAGDEFFRSEVVTGEAARTIPSRTLLYFEHKAADELSTLFGIKEGLVFPFHNEEERPPGIDGPLLPEDTTECYKAHMGIGHERTYP